MEFSVLNLLHFVICLNIKVFLSHFSEGTFL